MRDTLTVGAVARLSHVSPKTVRYYESLGLLPTARRDANGYRRYNRETVARMAFIQRVKQLGLTLGEIRDLMSVSDAGLCSAIGPELHRAVDRKIEDCDRRVAELTALRATLSSAALRLASIASEDEGVRPSCSAFAADCACLPREGLDIAAMGKV